MLSFVEFIPLLIFLPFMIFSLNKLKVKNGGNPLPATIISIYFIGALLSLFVNAKLWYPYFNSNSYSFVNFFLYGLCLIPFLLPAYGLKPLNGFIRFKRSKLQTILFLAFIFLGIFSFLYQLPYALISLTIGVSEVRHQQNNLGAFILPNSPLTTIAVAVSYFYYIYLAFYFISLSQKRNVFLRGLLLVGSLSYIVSGITFGTRDVFVNYLLAVFFSVFYFKNMLNIKQYNKIKKLLLITGVISFFGILIISIERFAERKDDFALAYGTIGYAGQQPYVFSVSLEEHKTFYNGDLRFPIFKGIFFDVKPIERSKHYETSFGTFVKDIYMEGGWTFLLISMLTFPLLFRFLQKVNGTRLVFSKIILDLYLFQFLTTGFFYYMLGSRAGNIYTIVLFSSLLGYYILKVLFNKGKNIER